MVVHIIEVKQCFCFVLSFGNYNLLVYSWVNLVLAQATKQLLDVAKRHVQDGSQIKMLFIVNYYLLGLSKQTH